jgi:hypothetical protein
MAFQHTCAVFDVIFIHFIEVIIASHIPGKSEQELHFHFVGSNGSLRPVGQGLARPKKCGHSISVMSPQDY